MIDLTAYQLTDDADCGMINYVDTSGTNASYNTGDGKFTVPAATFNAVGQKTVTIEIKSDQHSTAAYTLSIDFNVIDCSSTL